MKTTTEDMEKIIALFSPKEKTNTLKVVAKIVTRKEYLGFLLCWLMWVSTPLYRAYDFYWVIAIIISVFVGFALIRKYGN
jgi:hypothetical protein